MSNLEMKLDAVLRLCTAEDPHEVAAAREELRGLMQSSRKTKPEPIDPETEVRRILLELGAPDHLVGHPYLVQAILWSIDDRKYLDNITFGLYPALAAKFDTTASRVERAIRHLIEVLWTRCDFDTLNCYFGNTVSPGKGKATNGEFIARIANVVKLRMRDAAKN